MAQWKRGVGSWLCGGCGQVHGWNCPYFGSPGRRMSAAERAEAERRMAADRKTKPRPSQKPTSKSRRQSSVH